MMNPTEQILAIFEQIAAVPRPSRHEERIRNWLEEWAASHGFDSRADAAGNLVIRIPATKGLHSAPTVVLQGHMDMVCEKNPDSPHDFSRDPIRCMAQGDWLHADGTTLGADNGIAIAIALALAESKTVSHPPLELLFTVQEEVGMRGASRLDPALISGKVLINLDSEEDGQFIVGCAGGNTTHLHLPVQRVALGAGRTLLRLAVDGLQGGHSGAEIHKHRGNANKILVRALDRIQQAVPIELASLRGGTAHNAIPRSAEALFACASGAGSACREQVDQFLRQVRAEYATSDQRLQIRLEESAQLGPVVDAAGTAKAIQLALAVPDGVAEMSARIPGFVETSNNLAVLELGEDEFRVTSSQRSTVMSRLQEITRRIEAVAALAGARVEREGEYSAWQPSKESPLLDKSVEVYEALFHQKPQVKIIHAGLECGVIGERCGGLDMLSIGPTVRNAHSPSEMLEIPSVTRLWSFLTELLPRLAD